MYVTARAGMDAAYDCAVDGGGVATVAPGAKWDREGKNLTLVNVQGYYAGPDVMKFKRDNVPAYLAQPEHTVFGKLVIKNLPEMLAKGVVKVCRLFSRDLCASFLPGKPVRCAAEWTYWNSGRIGEASKG